ncbi:MAG: sigma-54 dependent transcriptional regulator [Pseudomonadota bacterium]
MTTISRGNVLIVEDSPTLQDTYATLLSHEGFEIDVSETAEGGLKLMNQRDFDVLLLDLELPGMSGMEMLDRISVLDHHPSVIVVTATGSVQEAVSCLSKGVIDFIEKPISPPRLSITVNNAIKQRALEHQVVQLKQTFQPEGFERFIGASEAMQTVYTLIRSAAPSTAPVFITGESGTGKELCAEAIHSRSTRADGPFVVLNCAAIPRELMESEIFGHEKGAFTGATSDRLGAAERADGGTLFLDELCEMHIDLQSKLLRFLQTKAIQKVGGAKTKHVDVRIVCATNRDPWEEVQRGNLREDLFYRLHVIPIPLPALRDRQGDSKLLAERFLTRYAEEENKPFAAFAPEVLDWIESNQWAGNVRELENAIRQIVVLNEGETVTRAMLPEQKLIEPTQDAPETPSANHLPTEPMELKPLWQFEKELIERAIDLCGDNVPKAAAALEISPSTIYRKLQSWEQREQI